MKVMRVGSPNQYTVLVKFRSQVSYEDNPRWLIYHNQYMVLVKFRSQVSYEDNLRWLT